MNAAETSASSAMADWTPLTVVSRSSTTAEIDTFISDVSTTKTNIAMASRYASRGRCSASCASGLLVASVIDGSASSRRLASALRSRSLSLTVGYWRSRASIVSTRIATVRACRTCLLSAGTTYHGAHSVEVAVMASS